MKKKNFFIVTFLVALLAVFSSCDSSNEQSETNSNEQEIENIFESEDELKDSLDKDNSEENEEQDEITEQPVNAGEVSTKDNNNLSMDVETNEKQENNKTKQKTDTDESEKKSSESKENIQISSGEEAVQYLKQQLPEGKDDDVSFGATEAPSTDSYGSYYTIQLVDIPTRVAGKTGTLGYYKVYQDGTYKDF